MLSLPVIACLDRVRSPARGVPGLNHRGRIRSADGKGRHNMVKVIVLLPRRADMSPESFKQHLRETHLPLSPSCPGSGGWC
jgi:hypothetical protein